MIDELIKNPRYDFSIISDRPDFVWPEGKRIALYLAINIEHFSYGCGFGAKINQTNPEPDVANFSWRDYGNRVGIWRLHSMCKELNIPVTLLVNSSIYSYAPSILDLFMDLPGEIAAHGYTNSESQSEWAYDKEFQFIDRVTNFHKEYDKKPPKGWLSPWVSETGNTSDILKKIGYEYTLNWCHDDQPTLLSTTHGPLVSVPYPQELNDIPAVLIRGASATEFKEMIIDHFNELVEFGGNFSTVMGIALHPYIMGQPHRLHQLRQAIDYIYNSGLVWKTTPGAISDYVLRKSVLKV